MNIIIPTIFLIAMIVISYTICQEYIKNKRAKAIQEAKDEENRFIIERKVMRDVKERAEYWDNFNVGLYVEYLENK
jgi:hypothetical protein